MEALLDKKPLNTTGLFEIKVPLDLPYITNTASFERYDGSIEVKGCFYNYVARIVTNDTLILVCIPNNEQNKISTAKNEYAGLVSIQNRSTPKNNSATLLLRLLKSEYNQQIIPYTSFPVNITTNSISASNDNTVCDATVSSPEQPPETI